MNEVGAVIFVIMFLILNPVLLVLILVVINRMDEDVQYLVQQTPCTPSYSGPTTSPSPGKDFTHFVEHVSVDEDAPTADLDWLERRNAREKRIREREGED